MFLDISRVNVLAVKYRNIHYKWLTLRLVFGFVLMAHLVSVSEISYHPGNVARQFILHNHQFNKQKRSSLKITLLHTNGLFIYSRGTKTNNTEMYFQHTFSCSLLFE